MTPDVETGVVSYPLDPRRIGAAVADESCGAVVTFRGVVRNHDAGMSVVAIDYSAHPAAPAILQEIAESVAGSNDVRKVEAWHRTGHLVVGDVALMIAVGSAHRAEAFAAASMLVDEIKARLPVWKRQELADGSHVWSGLT